MSSLLGFKLPTSSIIKNPCPLNDDVLFFSLSPILKMPTMPSTTSPSPHNRRLTRHHNFINSCQASVSANVEVEEGEEETTKVAGDYTMTQICDKIIEFFLNEKPRVKQWRKYLALRDEWRKYRESFYDRCRTRAETESDSNMKQKLRSLASKVKRPFSCFLKSGLRALQIDDEMERHSELLEEIQDSPTDLNALVTRRRKDFTGEFFRYLTTVAKTYDSLEDRDAMARLGARCLSAVSAYDNTLESVETLDLAQAKFDEILNSPSLEASCEKIKSLAKAKELDSSLILLISSAWASAKESTTMKNEVKEIMYQLYKTTKSSLRSIAPKEIKLLKYLLNIIDPEERFSALATAFSPGDEQEADKIPDALYTTPKELHKWVKIMLEAYQLNKEETDVLEAKKMTQPVVIQRLFILKDTIETEYLEKGLEEGTVLSQMKRGNSEQIDSQPDDLL
ncbi:hypothetical protein ACFE04_016900 [Oxalis oulophora]